MQGLQYLAQEHSAVKKQLDDVLGQRTQESQKRTIDNALREAGVPESGETREFAQEMARDMFHSFEPDASKGETMDTYMQAFPTMFSDRWSKWKAITRNMDKEDLARAKKQALPGSGGSATPSKPMKPEDDSVESILDRFQPEGGWTD